jgi:hypothetical protein
MTNLKKDARAATVHVQLDTLHTVRVQIVFETFFKFEDQLQDQTIHITFKNELVEPSVLNCNRNMLASQHRTHTWLASGEANHWLAI